MNFATIVGILLGLSVILFGIIEPSEIGGNITLMDQIGKFFDIKSISIVVLGTFAATMVNFSFNKIFGVFKVIANVFKTKESVELITVRELLKIAKTYQDSGPKGLEAISKTVNEPFVRNAMEMISVETNNERFNNYLNSELKSLKERHAQGQELLFNMGSYAPAFGMLGTVMGLILMMMSQMGTDAMEIDLNSVLVDMGLALRTTFYGVILANLFFIPMAGKLKNMSQQDIYIREIMIEGLTCIHRKEHPIIIKDKLSAYLPLELKLILKKDSDA
ncbi:MAG: MotA/TolQ/ExbB proton channel family protein [Candidatus Marinimicrobia bacterium]|nr:MotA/TolQ/ExbB proton channel family protein [Candidatus Neomarinimicrobiota bacterium]